MSTALFRGLTASAKSIDSGQPAQSAQADLSRNFSLVANSLYVPGPVYPIIKTVVKNFCYGSIILR